jgi:hypothetical protein
MLANHIVAVVMLTVISRFMGVGLFLLAQAL